MKTLKSQQGGELFSLLLFLRSQLQRYSSSPTAADFRTIKDGLQSTQSGRSPASLDNLVGEGEDRWRYSQAERVGSLQVDHQLELGRLLDR